ncbi:uncharacterized protein VP01_2072g3 [Puccinia sorghi]|uniref:Uncharacterized protein n=1 Tax=Puccinia sorghi TaxID=27349 RepID=A0A0L6VAG8_9BASI|nr:uncharacterized protein VP01_2072g3 [Puccinia sorghi]
MIIYFNLYSWLILDPRIKLRHLEKKQSFLVQHKISYLTVDDAIKSFKYEAQASDHSPSKMQPTTTSENKGKEKCRQEKGNKTAS